MNEHGVPYPGIQRTRSQADRIQMENYPGVPRTKSQADLIQKLERPETQARQRQSDVDHKAFEARIAAEDHSRDRPKFLGQLSGWKPIQDNRFRGIFSVSANCKFFFGVCCVPQVRTINIHYPRVL